MAPPEPARFAVEPTGLLLTASSRDLMRDLRPTAWTVLQDVLLEARTENGRLVSHTAARRVSTQLGMDVSTAARALRLLRSRGLLVLEQAAGTDGRFGLAAYLPNVPSGVVLVPGAAPPCTAPPCTVNPYTVNPRTVRGEGARSEPRCPPDQSPDQSVDSPVPGGSGQGAFNLGLEAGR